MPEITQDGGGGGGGGGGENVRVVLEAEDAEEASLWVDLLNHAIEDHTSTSTAAAASAALVV